MNVLAALLIVFAYLCGAIPFGLLVGWTKRIDIRKHGSGNIGATNVGRVLGRTYGLTVFALDLVKGLVPTLVASHILLTHHISTESAGALVYLALVAVLAASIFGHMFPIYLRFRGGKGVATSLGAALGLYPWFTWPILVAFGIWIVVTWASRYVSLGSIVAAVAFPIAFAVYSYVERARWAPLGNLWPLYLFSVLLALMVVIRHRGNIRRLLAGTESKIGKKAAARTA